MIRVHWHESTPDPIVWSSALAAAAVASFDLPSVPPSEDYRTIRIVDLRMTSDPNLVEARWFTFAIVRVADPGLRKGDATLELIASASTLGEAAAVAAYLVELELALIIHRDTPPRPPAGWPETPAPEALRMWPSDIRD